MAQTLVLTAAHHSLAVNPDPTRTMNAEATTKKDITIVTAEEAA
jgi:hypothetical protein